MEAQNTIHNGSIVIRLGRMHNNFKFFSIIQSTFAGNRFELFVKMGEIIKTTFKTNISNRRLTFG
jgi:hypothetical protein